MLSQELLREGYGFSPAACSPTKTPALAADDECGLLTAVQISAGLRAEDELTEAEG